MDEWSSGWGGRMQEAEGPIPTPLNYGPVGPFGCSIYADGGVGAGTPTDGIHVWVVPNNSYIVVKDRTGAWLPAIPGPAIVVTTGTLAPDNLILIDTFTTFADGTVLDFAPDTEYFYRMHYWPEQEQNKQFNHSNPWDGELVDRRLRLWVGKEWAETGVKSDKKRWKYVGEAAVIEDEYVDERKYMYLTAMDYYMDLETGEYEEYTEAVIQHHEVVCASGWVPYDKGKVHLGIDDDGSWGRLEYARESDEREHAWTGEGGFSPQFQVKDEVEVWAYHKRLRAEVERVYATDFRDPLPDGWTVTNNVGTWGQEDSVGSWRDEFVNEYADKGNDPDWSVL